MVKREIAGVIQHLRDAFSTSGCAQEFTGVCELIILEMGH
jgi:hypothetical protein